MRPSRHAAASGLGSVTRTCRVAGNACSAPAPATTDDARPSPPAWFDGPGCPKAGRAILPEEDRQAALETAISHGVNPRKWSRLGGVAWAKLDPRLRPRRWAHRFPRPAARIGDTAPDHPRAADPSARCTGSAPVARRVRNELVAADQGSGSRVEEIDREPPAMTTEG